MYLAPFPVYSSTICRQEAIITSTQERTMYGRGSGGKRMAWHGIGPVFRMGKKASDVGEWWYQTQEYLGNAPLAAGR